MKYLLLLLIVYGCIGIRFTKYESVIYESDSVKVVNLKSTITIPYNYFESKNLVEDYMKQHTYTLQSDNFFYSSLLMLNKYETSNVDKWSKKHK